MNVSDFKPGERVKAHPATDAFMRGDVYGTVKAVGRTRVRVAMDRSGVIRAFHPDNLLHVED